MRNNLSSLDTSIQESGDDTFTKKSGCIKDEFNGEFEDSVLRKPGEDSGEYLGHFVPESGTGRAVGEGVLNHVNVKYGLEVELCKQKLSI